MIKTINFLTKYTESMSYRKNLESDFPVGLNTSELQKIINSNASIKSDCIHISCRNNNVDFSFENELDNDEQSALDTTIGDYSPTSEGESVKEKKTVQTTNSVKYQTRDTLTTEYLTSQSYIINWQYSFTSSDGNPDIRIIVDDDIIIHHKINRVPVISATLEYEVGGFNIWELTEGVHTIALQFRVGDEKNQLTINSSCLAISKQF